MSAKAVVAGVGMIPFVKPGTSDTYDLMGARAVRFALEDAGITYGDVGQAYAGYVYGDSSCGQRALYHVGLTGIPLVNVNNNCASGSSALFLARQAVEAGAVDCALAFGFEQMMPGALPTVFADRPDPLADWKSLSQDLQPADPATPPAAHLFGGAGVEHAAKYGTRPETFARISEKARRHAEHNDRAIFRTPLTVEQILASPTIYGILTRYQCCPPTCGAAAALIVSEDFARKRGIDASIRILGQELMTDLPSSFGERSMIKAVGFDLSKTAAARVYEMAGIGPDEVDVCELHDCFTANELVTYEALGFAPEGGAEKFILDGDNTYGGKVVTNPSGGLLSKGHPLGATGLAQCFELVEQLRGKCGPRQVENARFALQHNIGTGSACAVTLYGKV
ncbi:acetyl-CoA acyltransferase (plasmid) [Azospirillum sp. B510]|uniref:lipid-transfer protein n=1 Tax=Azospirillum sp. (strain B510) TaxID=137722 RepID=UPI0001C4B8B9|nr:lipid-transfer protein [Azospirillum sp. B510]BAI74642.1 acetyl-CoA acyltransferase [Azospirillum sp. B510]